MSLTEADVLFEMVLPLLCKEHAAAMERFKGVVVFEQTGTEPRHWTLKGGAKPWVQRGDTAKADARISVDTDVTGQVIRARSVLRTRVRGRRGDDPRQHEPTNEVVHTSW